MVFKQMHQIDRNNTKFIDGIKKNVLRCRQRVFMKANASKEKTAVVARKAKRRLENSLIEVQKVEKVVVEAERQRKMQRTADEKCERLRVVAEGRCATGVEGLAIEVTRNSSRRKCYPLTNEQKSEKARVKARRRSVIKLNA